jgi:hypothetical protein
VLEVSVDKVNKAAAVSIVFFSVVLAGFIGARVDQTTIALLGGAFIGLIVAVPATVLVVLVAIRRRDDGFGERPLRHSAPMPQSPPQYWVMPSPHYDLRVPSPMQAPVVQGKLQQPLVAPELMLPAVRRRFYVIGESGDVREIEAPFDPSDPMADDALRF